MRSSQPKLILNYLRRYRQITPWIALRRFHCFRLADVIWKLRGRGHGIRTVLVPWKGTRYARYRLAK